MVEAHIAIPENHEETCLEDPETEVVTLDMEHQPDIGESVELSEANIIMT